MWSSSCFPEKSLSPCRRPKTNDDLLYIWKFLKAETPAVIKMGKNKFTEGERVLCYHGILLYEAKCLEHRTNDKVVEFKVHYAGWNKSWDEWVPEDRILKYNETSLQKQKELKKEFELSKAAAKKKGLKRKSEAPKAETPTSSSRASTPSSDASSVKTPTVSSAKSSLPPPPPPKETSEPEAKVLKEEPVPVKQDEPVEKSVPVKLKDENLLQELEIPVELRKVLVDDWYLIQKQDKLYNLPAKHTVRDIFDDYVKYKVAKSECDKSVESALREIGRGICSLFDTLLGKQLLYKFERPQYAELLQKHPYKGMSHIYGAPHLLRLFCWKQGLVPKSQFDDVSCEYLMKHLNSIIKYCCQNKSTLFSTDNYMTSTPEYHRRVI
ncbi:mortality factor 4-like protein 1 isoform X2 [Neocloeon triangulifer]|uniref:mortality factor 4-like protein 1 isoform X2 n=1 Tax=Neocloeon triangulifer TaxID=2078957 RepID=UPI00286F3169|nr:mortality factor 4-like protein 1 isoform X2 [Neocloeon triangulifer]